MFPSGFEWNQVCGTNKGTRGMSFHDDSGVDTAFGGLLDVEPEGRGPEALIMGVSSRRKGGLCLAANPTPTSSALRLSLFRWRINIMA